MGHSALSFLTNIVSLCDGSHMVYAFCLSNGSAVEMRMLKWVSVNAKEHKMRNKFIFF
jgi:hypothetical protein